MDTKIPITTDISTEIFYMEVRKYIRIPYLLKVKLAGIIDDRINPERVVELLRIISTDGTLELNISKNERKWKETLDAAKYLGIGKDLNLIGVYVKSLDQRVHMEIRKLIVKEIIENNICNTPTFLAMKFTDMECFLNDIKHFQILKYQDTLDLEVDMLKKLIKLQQENILTISESVQIPLVNEIVITGQIPIIGIMRNYTIVKMLKKLGNVNDFKNFRSLNHEMDLAFEKEFFDAANYKLVIQSSDKQRSIFSQTIFVSKYSKLVRTVQIRKIKPEDFEMIIFIVKKIEETVKYINIYANYIQPVFMLRLINSIQSILKKKQVNIKIYFAPPFNRMSLRELCSMIESLPEVIKKIITVKSAISKETLFKEMGKVDNIEIIIEAEDDKK